MFDKKAQIERIQQGLAKSLESFVGKPVTEELLGNVTERVSQMLTIIQPKHLDAKPGFITLYAVTAEALGIEIPPDIHPLSQCNFKATAVRHSEDPRKLTIQLEPECEHEFEPWDYSHDQAGARKCRKCCFVQHG